MSDLYLTASLPYVNGAPHLGHALEYVQADVLARHARSRGRSVRFHSGTDDHAHKNLVSARNAGLPVSAYVAAQAAQFDDLRAALTLSFDDYLHTSSDPRHALGVTELWRRLDARGDLYRASYDGLYCAGCEQFFAADELAADGTCGDHSEPAEPVAEQNWFFRLSRYAEQLRHAIESGALRIEPEPRRNEVLSFLRSGLHDISVSRDARRADGWGIPVPDDDSQVIYVWLDALTNYISALRFGDLACDDYERWWRRATVERIHVVGKGIIRFHAVYWCAFLLSAGLPLPDAILVHDYLTVDGAKIGKSLGNGVDPFALVQRHGTDAVRWWLLREVPRVGDTDFTEAALVTATNRDLANGFGNLVQRITKLTSTTAAPIADLICERVADDNTVEREVDAALHRFDFRGAIDAIFTAIDAANRHLERTAPWSIRDELDRAAAIAPALHAARLAARELTPFVPTLAAVASARLASLAVGEPIFARLRDR